MTKYGVNSSQLRLTKQSTRHTILGCDEFTVCNTSTTNAGDMSWRSVLSLNTDWLSWQRPSTNRKRRLRSIICTQSIFIIIVQIAKFSPVYPEIFGWIRQFWPVVQVSSVNSGVTGPNLVHEIFIRYRGIIYAVNAHIEVAISYSVSEWQSDKCRG